MPSFTKEILSGTTNGIPILISSTTLDGTAIHTAVGNTSDWDEVWLWAYNNSNSAVSVQIFWAGVTEPDCRIESTISSLDKPFNLIPGWIINDGKGVTAIAGSGNSVSISGYVNRITA